MKTTRTYGHRSVVSEQMFGFGNKSPTKRQTQNLSHTTKEQIERNVNSKENELNFEQLISTFISMHGGVCLENNRLHNSLFINNSPLICDILSSDVGRYAVLCALQFSLTLCLPHDTFSIPTPEFIVSHLIRRHPKSKAFMALNGTVGILKNEIIKYKKTHGELWKCQYDLMHEFLTQESHVQEEDDDIGINVLGGDILHTPIGAIPVLIIEEPFRWEGCSWEWGWDDVDNWKINKVEFIDNTIDDLLGKDFPNLRYVENLKKSESFEKRNQEENEEKQRGEEKDEKIEEKIEEKEVITSEIEIEKESEDELSSTEELLSQFIIEEKNEITKVKGDEKKLTIARKKEENEKQRNDVISTRRQTVIGIMETQKSPSDTSVIVVPKPQRELSTKHIIMKRSENEIKEPAKEEEIKKEEKVLMTESIKIYDKPKKNEMDKGLQDDYEVFKSFLNFPCNITIQDNILVSIKRFPSLVKGMGLKERAEVMYDLMQEVMDNVSNSPVEMDGFYKRMFVKHLWDVFTTSLFNYLWPPIIERNEGDVVFECNQRDAQLSTIISTHQFVAPHHFDLGFLESDLGKRGVDLIGKELRRINSHCSPRNKSFQIYNCFKLATEVVGRLQSTAVSADLLLPTILFCIIHSSPLNLVSTIEYLTIFTPRWAALPSEVSYYIAHMHSAVSFLLGFSQRSLTISPNDYSLFLYYSKRRVNPYIRPKSILLKDGITWNIDKKEGESEVNTILFNASHSDLAEDDAPVLLACYKQLLSDNKPLSSKL